MVPWPMAWDAEPMLAELSSPFSGDGWLFEIKYDGFRLLAGCHRGRPRLRYRRGADATDASATTNPCCAFETALRAL